MHVTSAIFMETLGMNNFLNHEIEILMSFVFVG